MKKITILFAFCCFSSSFLLAQTTAIPDANFEQALIDLGIDTNGLNGNILNVDAEGETGALVVSNLAISNLSGIEAFINITVLHCQQNPLGSLDISNNTALTTLQCFTNQLTSLDVSQNIALETLGCSGNNLSSLDLSQNTALGFLNCIGNNLSSLDLSQNTVLYDIFCQNNQLTSLDLRNGNNTNINTASINAVNNPNLLCIDVDNVVYAVTNWTSVDPQTSFSIECDALNVFVPDDNFEQALIDLGIDIGGPVLDDFALILNINSITTLDVSSKNIFDFTGINHFVALEDLNVSLNPIQNFTFDINNLTALKTLTCAISQLMSLDVSNNTALENLNCNSNQLSSLDVSNNTLLVVLRCASNELTSLDVSNLTVLQDLRCENNELNSLDVSNNTDLEKLFLLGNELTSLDVSNNAQLISLTCQNNQLISLDVRNGNNLNITTSSFNASNNPDLTCIDVDDVAYSTTNWTSIDAQTSFSLDCSINPTVSIPDANFEQALIDLGIDTNGLTGTLLETDAIGITSISVTNKNINDLTGIEIFTDLEVLNCQQNNLSSLDLSQNINLLNLSCFTNQLSSLNISQNTELLTLLCAVNELTILDVSNNTKLTIISCFANELGSLDLSQNTMLTSLDCFNNQLTDLDVRNGNNTNMTNFTAYNNSLLTCIFVDDAVYSATNWTNIDSASTFVETEVACSTLGVDDFEQNINLVLYPNPVEDVLHIKVSDNLLISKVELFDVSGKKIMSTSATDTLNVSQLHSGLYFVSITVDNNVVTKKLIIK